MWKTHHGCRLFFSPGFPMGLPHLCGSFLQRFCDLTVMSLESMTNIAMGNGPFIDGLPLKNGDFPWLC